MNKFLLVLCIFIISFVSGKPQGSLELPPPPPPIPRRSIVCYFASWTVYRPGKGAFNVNDIDPHLCTHINFAFVGLNEDASIHILDPWESSDPNGINGFTNLVNLKKVNNNLKIMLSMGGWNEGSAIYSQVASDELKRKKLAQNILNFLQQWGFDGFDLDWEYPGYRGGDATIDKVDFTELLKEISAVLKPEGYLLTAAVAGTIEKIDAYDVPAISELLDMINIMTYDYHGQEYEMYVGHVSPLYPSSLDLQNKNNETANVKTGIETWLSHGAPPEKINLGIATYGRSFTLADAKKISLYDPIVGAGQIGPYTGQIGVLGYNEICEYHLRTNYYWDDEQKVPHRVWGNQWVGFEDKRSIQFKTEFALDHNLGGIMIWSLDTDDFRNTCRGGVYPLINAVRDGLYGPTQ